MLSKDIAICLRAVDYSETSQIVTFFTRDNGKVSAIAKGAKRAKSAFDGPIELFSYGQIVFSDTGGEKLSTLTEFQQAPAFTHLASNLFAMNCSLFAAELIDKLTCQADPNSRLFDCLLQFLKDLQQADDKKEILGLFILFEFSLLKEIGLLPVLRRCANCKSGFNTKWSEIYFSSKANGLVCRDCQMNFPSRVKLSTAAAGTLADLKLIAQADMKILNELERILIYHFTEMLHSRPKMAKYVLGK